MRGGAQGEQKNGGTLGGSRRGVNEERLVVYYQVWGTGVTMTSANEHHTKLNHKRIAPHHNKGGASLSPLSTPPPPVIQIDCHAYDANYNTQRGLAFTVVVQT